MTCFKTTLKSFIFLSQKWQPGLALSEIVSYLSKKGKSIFEFDRLGKVAESYTLFAKEVLEQDAKQRRKNALVQLNHAISSH